MSINDPNIPEKGWYFKLGSVPRDCKIWHDGKQIKNVTRVAIEVNAKMPLPVARIDTVGNTALTCALPDENVLVSNEPWPREVSKQCSLPGLEPPERQHPLGLTLISMKEFVQWLFVNVRDCIDYDLVLFFGTHSEKIYAEVTDEEGVGVWYAYLDFHLRDESVIRWSVDDGWDYPVEDALRALWNISRYGR
jgi:hypothetical protein